MVIKLKGDYNLGLNYASIHDVQILGFCRCTKQCTLISLLAYNEFLFEILGQLTMKPNVCKPC
jgi:hypothetical protein